MIVIKRHNDRLFLKGVIFGMEYGSYAPQGGGFDGHQDFFLQKAQQRRRIRTTASFIGIALIMVTALGRFSMNISVWLMGMFGAQIELVENTFYGSELLYWIACMLSSAITMFIPAVLLYFALGMPFRIRDVIKTPNPAELGVSVPITLFATIVSSYIISYIEAIFSSAGVSTGSPTYPEAQTPAMIIMYIIYMTVIPAVFEELMFRGVIMTSLRRFGDGFAVVVSALLFGLLHGNLLQSINAFFLGLLLGYFAVKSGSVITAMVIHFANNLLYAAFNLILPHLSDTQANMVVAVVYGLIAVAGIVALIVYLKKSRTAFRLIKLPTMLTGPERAFNTFTALGMLAAVLYFCYVIVSQMSFVQ